MSAAMLLPSRLTVPTRARSALLSPRLFSSSERYVAVVNAGVLRLASVEAFTLEETEVARLVAYLARPEAGFVTGSAITINGGCLA